jgi:heme-degrading monooxygenase HmoA
MGEFAERFANRAGRVESAEGFESFELLRPNDGRDVCLVLTRWRSEQDFEAWMNSADFGAGHSQHRERGPVGSASEVWSFDVLERI